VKQLMIYPVLAFLLSLGGSTAYLVKTHKPAPVASESLHPQRDATAKDSAAADSLKHAMAGRDSSAKPDSIRADSGHGAARPDSMPGRAQGVQAVPATGPQIPVRPAAAAVDPAAKSAAYKQVARVLSAMKPVEAAKVLAFLSDEEVEGLLRAVGPRQAADFLTNIPKERAAGLSRRLLAPKGQSR